MTINDELDQVRYFHDGSPMFYGRSGEAISLRQWADMFGDFSGRIIAEDRFGNWRILTVWLGLDDDPLDDGPPLIFRSAIYHHGVLTAEHGTPSEDAARAQHQQLMEQLS